MLQRDRAEITDFFANHVRFLGAVFWARRYELYGHRQPYSAVETVVQFTRP